MEDVKDSFVYHSEYGGDTEVKLEILPYLNNGRLGISLVGFEDGMPEPYGNLTVNIDEPTPDYCGYLDTNNLSNAEKFVVDNDLGEFTGLTGRSGFCE